MSEVERSGFGVGMVEDLRREAGAAGGEQPAGFFPKYGSPVPGVGGEKPGEFFPSGSIAEST